MNLEHSFAIQSRGSTNCTEPTFSDRTSKEQEPAMSSHGEKLQEPVAAAVAAAQVPSVAQHADETQLTCDVLCSLSNSCSPSPADCKEECEKTEICNEKVNDSFSKCCPKQHQLPMFLSKTYHMIDRCDPAIATWSDTGDNFVIKNVEKFASSVLPQYFKHSNFSSFARQLNFYGFRKIKAEPILTSDYDARTACYVRFFHEKFQKDRPELLNEIKRATKADMQSKDEVDCLREEICKLKECVHNMSTDCDRKMAEMSYEYNRRITSLAAEHDRLAILVQQLLAKHGESMVMGNATLGPGGVTDLMHSLSQAASLSLQNNATARPSGADGGVGAKRPATEEPTRPSSRLRAGV